MLEHMYTCMYVYMQEGSVVLCLTIMWKNEVVPEIREDYIHVHVHMFTKVRLIKVESALKLTFFVGCLHNVFPHDKSLLKYWSTAWQHSLINNTQTADTLSSRVRWT